MSGEITLHPTLGVNPRLTYCPACGKEGKELVLLGIRNYIDRCPSCDARLIGGPDRPNRRSPIRRCGRCGYEGGISDFNAKRRTLTEHERVPGSRCDACDEFYRVLREAAANDGGVGARCEKCGSKFVVKGDSAFARNMRAQAHANPQFANIGPNDPIIFGVPGCMHCAPAEATPATA